MRVPDMQSIVGSGGVAWSAANRICSTVEPMAVCGGWLALNAKMAVFVLDDEVPLDVEPSEQCIYRLNQLNEMGVIRSGDVSWFSPLGIDAEVYDAVKIPVSYELCGRPVFYRHVEDVHRIDLNFVALIEDVLGRCSWGLIDRTVNVMNGRDGERHAQAVHMAVGFGGCAVVAPVNEKFAAKEGL